MTGGVRDQRWGGSVPGIQFSHRRPFPLLCLVAGLALNHMEVSETGEPDDGGWSPRRIEGAVDCFPRLTPNPPCPLD